MSSNYSTIENDPYVKNHLVKFIDWLLDEVQSAGGDGDGLWYSRFHDVNEIKDLITERNLLRKNWAINFDGKTIFLYNGQESLVITNEESLYNNAPSYQQILIKY